MKLKVADTEIQVNEDYTLTTSEIAKFYGITPQTIRDHKRTHSDEFIENIHYIEKTSQRGTKKLFWTLEGVYMLGFFIKSERAKKYRKAVAQLLTEIKKGKAQITPTQPHLIENNEQMVEELIKRSDIVRGYQGQIAKLENELAQKQSEIKNLQLQANNPFEMPLIKEYIEVLKEKEKQLEKIELISQARNKYIFDKLMKICDEMEDISHAITQPVKEDKNFFYIGKAMLPKNKKL